MFNTEIIYTAAGMPGIETITIKGYCKVCGKSIDEGVKEGEVLSGNFTNWAELKAIKSKYICKACAWCMKNAELRQNNFISDSKNLYLLKKNDLEEYLFNLGEYVDDEFVVGITTSFKKHNSFRCKVSTDTKRFWIRQEDKEYIFDVRILKPVYDMLKEAYLQFSKDELLTGQYKMISIEQFGINRYREYESVFKLHRGSAQFELLVFIMNSERRNEIIQEKIKAEKAERMEKK